MTVKAFLEALNNNASIVIKESDNTQIAEFNRNSYKAISDKILARLTILKSSPRVRFLSFSPTRKPKRNPRRRKTPPEERPSKGYRTAVPFGITATGKPL